MFVRSPADKVADRPAAGDARWMKHKNSKERSPPMKVKTNTKAGSAMWGS
jgi:hypothetical protein